MAMDTTVKKRSEQAAADCWSIEDLFPSDQAWEEAFAACQALPGQLAAYRGRLGESAQALYEYLELGERTDRQAETVYAYTSLRHDEDTADPAYQAMSGRCFRFLVELGSAAAFEGPELAAIPEETLEGFYAQLPALEKYRRYLTKARLEREHILSPAEEALLAAAGELGFRSLYGIYGGSRNALAAMLNAEIRKCVFFARARHYESTLASAMHPVEVPEAVYHNLLETVHRNLGLLHRYMALRKKALGVEELHMYDLYAGMVPASDEVIPFQQAQEEVLEAAKVLGEDYHRVLSQSFEQRWMDRYENEGKRSGAYSHGCAVHPYVLLNHRDNLNSEFTLAHEMGHAMHSYLSCQKQPPVYAGYVLFVAEVASTCNEALLMQYLLKKTTDRKRRAVLINYFLEQFRTTLYRQTMFAEFELAVHRLSESGETLTAQRLCEVYYELNQRYYGPDVVVDREIEMEWARIPHFYRRFYVYQYATGFSAAMALSKRILEGGQEAVDGYLRFLSGGSSTDPVSLLKIAGVDMSTPQPVEDALALFGRLIGEMEALLA